jgi:hypothetical protein
VRRKSVVNAHSQRAFEVGTRKGLISMIGYGSALPLAYVNSYISLLLFFVVAMIWAIPDRNFEKAVEEITD